MGAWWELRLLGLPRAELDAASTRLFALGASGLQEDWLPGTAPPPRQPWDRGPPPPPPERILLRAWFEAPDRDRIDAALASVGAERQWAPVPEVDWESAWRASFAPVRASPRLTVAPPWDAPEGSVIIEPGQGFGSGAHPTTRMCLAALDRLADDHRTVLDVGCGSGILAIAAARLGLEATGIDIDAPGIAQARRNAARNGVAVDLSTTPLAALEGTWELVLANLHAERILELADDLLARVGRTLVLAGILADRAEGVRARFDPCLERLDDVTEGPWVALVYRVRP